MDISGFNPFPLKKMVAGGEQKEEGSDAGGEEEQPPPVEISWPSDVRHVAHVTFDRFHGYRGLPSDLEPEVAGKAPSASKTVFGVSTEFMQCSYDTRGNSVPTVLLLMQRRLYERGGLKVEGIFRITPDGNKEQDVRDQLNRDGGVPDDVDVHCLSGLIKAWFRELPGGLLDSLPERDVIRCQTEEDCTALCAKLPPAKAALLDWAVQLMADIAAEEKNNRMGTRNVAMVFAPNMTQGGDPMTALKYTVQVMNFLNLLIEKALRERLQQQKKPRKAA